MKKTALLLAAYMVVLICFTACGTNKSYDDETEKTTMSDEERMSFYDDLAHPGELSNKEATDPEALYIIDDNNGSRDLLDDTVYNDIINVFNKKYPDIYYKYGDRNYTPPRITLNLDVTSFRDVPAYVVGNTININVEWFNKYPERVSTVLYYVARTVLDYNSSAPEWLTSSINYYIAVEFSAYGYAFTNGYKGGTYEDGGATGADFLRWVGSKYNTDIVSDINKVLISETWFDGDFWVSATGRTLDQLWANYKAG